MTYRLCLWLIVVSGPAWSWAWIGDRAWGDLFVSPKEPSNERPVGLGPGLPAGRYRRPPLQHGVSMVARLFHRGWFWEHETTNVNVNDESAIDNMSEEELIKRIEEQANRLGAKMNLRID